MRSGASQTGEADYRHGCPCSSFWDESIPKSGLGFMRITRLYVISFRSIKNIDMELGDTTVFIGPNNGGKTAILDAVRIALTRRWGQRGTGFTEYDVHLADERDDPKASQGIAIELRAEEKAAGEW